MEKPNCYECKHRGDLVYNVHSCCGNIKANVTGNAYGKSQGWFYWPTNFDPIWLESCDGFELRVE
jgi:hypothetical protein